jgi:uracil-DNA glycosylase
VPRRLELLKSVHSDLDACSACPDMIGPVVHGPAVLSRVLLLGQAPGPREGSFGRPFAWTAGRTLFRWFEEALDVDEATFRKRVYMAAVARCFPGKASGGGDRKPDAEEILRCRTFLEREVDILRPELVLAVGTLAIGEVLGEQAKGKKLDVLVGDVLQATWNGHDTDVIALPHPSGASPWHKLEPGKTLLHRALRAVRRHPAVRASLALVAALLVLGVATTARADTPNTIFGLSFSIAREGGERVVDDAWVNAQIDEANRLFSPFGTRFRWTTERELAEPHGEVHTRAERDALTPLTEPDQVDVFLVRALEDVDEPGRMRMGVCWTGRAGKRFLVVSKIARPSVLAHELGHFFGNPHSTVTNNLMSYSRAPEQGPVFLDASQGAKITSFTTAFLRSGRLVDVGPAWRFW